MMHIHVGTFYKTGNNNIKNPEKGCEGRNGAHITFDKNAAQSVNSPHPARAASPPPLAPLSLLPDPQQLIIES